jgi:hypothetical protein
MCSGYSVCADQIFPEMTRVRCGNLLTEPPLLGAVPEYFHQLAGDEFDRTVLYGYFGLDFCILIIRTQLKAVIELAFQRGCQSSQHRQLVCWQHFVQSLTLAGSTPALAAPLDNRRR